MLCFYKAKALFSFIIPDNNKSVISCICDAGFNNFHVSQWHKSGQHSPAGTMASFRLGA
jgi:hypothetical protein